MNNITSRSALALLAIFSTTGCALQGERAGTLIGACPTGEICSDQAPKGLLFWGAKTSDSLGGDVAITAKGGTQTINVSLNSGDADPFSQAFDADTSDINVAAISAVAPPTVVVSGESDGTSLLRLLEPGTDKLLDRVSIQVATIDKVTLFPDQLYQIEEKNAPWALFSGTTTPIIVRLAAKNGDRLIDESIALTPAFGSAAPLAWDLFGVTAPTSGDASFTINAGNGSFTAKIPVVAAIDEIMYSTLLGNFFEEDKLDVSTGRLLCFVGRSSGVATVGAKWTFTGSSTLQIEPKNSLLPGLDSCANVTGTAIGPATLTVDASSFTRTFNLNFAKKMAKSAHGKPLLDATHHLTPAIAGERAGNDARSHQE